MKRLCQVYKSARKEEMYLYVDKGSGLEEVPEALMASFGEPLEVMSLVLEPGRKLARADAQEVLDNIEQHGFYLQMPPSAQEWHRRESGDE